MPRKNVKPASKKRREKLKSKMSAEAKKHRVGIIAHSDPGRPNMAVLALLANQAIIRGIL